MRRSGILASAVAVAATMWFASGAEAQQAEVIVDTCKVSARKHTDDFTGRCVLVAQITDPKGIPVGGARVEFDPKNGAELVVTTPSGIQVTVRDDCAIAPEGIAIRDFIGTYVRGSGIELSWVSTVEDPSFRVFVLSRRLPGESAFLHVAKVGPPGGVGTLYRYIDSTQSADGATIEYRLEGVLNDGVEERFVDLGTISVFNGVVK